MEQVGFCIVTSIACVIIPSIRINCGFVLPYGIIYFYVDYYVDLFVILNFIPNSTRDHNRWFLSTFMGQRDVDFLLFAIFLGKDFMSSY